MADNTKKDYVNLKNKIEKIIKSLESSGNHLKTAQNELKHYFKIDGASADNNKIGEIKQENDQIKKYLKENVLPEINSKINS